MRTTHSFVRFLLAAFLVSVARPFYGQEAGENRLDLLTFAQGATVVSVDGSDAELRVSDEQALYAIDGNPSKYVLTPKPGSSEARVELVYLLPAATTFDTFVIPSVHETPSPSQTFIKDVKVYGSVEGPDSGFELIAEATLATHESADELSTLSVMTEAPVRWVKVVLSQGIEVINEKTFFDFSEIIGYGLQDPVSMSNGFTGQWKGRGVKLSLTQDGPLVSGCYDGRGTLTGTVTGNMLRATGVGLDDGVQSLFVISVDAEGNLDGVRSTNGSPFRRYVGSPGNVDSGCDPPGEPVLGCGDTVYGINFDFDSANLRDESTPVIERLYEGLKSEESSEIVIEGHTSSEGTEAYNQQLSERRAQAVVDALVAMGIDSDRLTAAGLGELRPIADNGDESGRSLNRRVEIKCR